MAGRQGAGTCVACGIGLRLWRARRGVAALEAALILPVMIVFLVGFMETGWQLLTAMVLQNGAEDAARFIETGHTASGGTCASLPDLVAGSSGGILRAAQVHVSAEPRPDSTAFYTFSYTQAYFTPWMSMLVGQAAMRHSVRVLIHDTAPKACAPA